MMLTSESRGGNKSGNENGQDRHGDVAISGEIVERLKCVEERVATQSSVI